MLGNIIKHDNSEFVVPQNILSILNMELVTCELPQWETVNGNLIAQYFLLLIYTNFFESL